MLHQQTGVPVCVCVHRASAVEYLSRHTDADIVFADDGLQHLAMARDAEIVVVDGVRGFGNGWLLPAGPLREPSSRLAKADIVAVQANHELHGSLNSCAVQARQPELFANTFELTLTDAIALENACTDETSNYRVNNVAGQPGDMQRISLNTFAGQSVVAMAGIGHPERFFKALRQLGLKVSAVAQPDHHSYTVQDLEAYGSQPILVTSKDAVKIRALGALRAAVFEVPTSLKPSNALLRRIVLLEQAMRVSRQKTGSS